MITDRLCTSTPKILISWLEPPFTGVYYEFPWMIRAPNWRSSLCFPSWEPQSADQCFQPLEHMGVCSRGWETCHTVTGIDSRVYVDGGCLAPAPLRLMVASLSGLACYTLLVLFQLSSLLDIIVLPSISALATHDLKGLFCWLPPPLKTCSCLIGTVD